MGTFAALLLSSLAAITLAGEYSSTLVVQTGLLRESDLIIRNISDLASKKTCLAFYVRTAGTRPVMYCYDASAGFGAAISQVGHIKADDLVIRKVEDAKNGVSCLVAYVSTPGTSPAVDCFVTKHRFKESLVENAHLREGDLSVRRIVDSGSQMTCLVAYVDTKGTSPSTVCYESQVAPSPGGLIQTSFLKEGDLIVRKINDPGSHKACMVTYVSTESTSTNIYCFDE